MDDEQNPPAPSGDESEPLGGNPNAGRKAPGERSQNQAEPGYNDDGDFAEDEFIAYPTVH